MTAPRPLPPVVFGTRGETGPRCVQGIIECRGREPPYVAGHGEHEWQVLQTDRCSAAVACLLRRRQVMEVVAARCAGLDVHRSVIVACALLGEGGQFASGRRFC